MITYRNDGDGIPRHYTSCPQCLHNVVCDKDGAIKDHVCNPYQPPAQIGCIIPIYGHAKNSHLKDFVKWFNENYTVTKKQ